MSSLMPMDPGVQNQKNVLRSKNLPERCSVSLLFRFESEEQLKKAIFWAFFPEYLGLPLFYYLGKFHHMMASYILQAVFLAGSSHLQLSGFKLVVSPEFIEREYPGYKFQSYATPGRAMLAPLTSIMGVPTKWLGMRKWQYDMTSLAPNYLQIITTVQAIAAVEDEYRGEPAQAFTMRWQNVRVIGQYVADLGLVNVLKVSVLFNMICHFLGLLRPAGSPALKAEASNLLFLEKAMNPDQNVHVVRTLAAPLVKVPMIWMKVSLLSLLYDGLISSSNLAGLRSLILAILLALYGLIPILPGWWEMTSDFLREMRQAMRNRGACKVVFFCVILTQLLAFGLLMGIVLAHFVGVFACASHDLSLANLGCTSPLTNTSSA